MDWEKLLAPISDDEPCGPDPYEESYEFGPLDDMLRADEDGGMVEGEGAGEPNWNEVQKTCEGIFAEGKHLRTAVILTYVLLKRNGLNGFVEGLSLIHGLLDQLWAHVYPELDADDDNEAWERLNTLAEIAAPIGRTVGFIRFLRTLEDAPLFSAQRLGRKISLLDVRRARGESEAPEGVAVLDMSLVQGAFGDSDAEEVARTSDLVAQAMTRLQEINAVLARECAGESIPIEPLVKVLQAMAGTILELQGAAPAPVEEGEVPVAEGAAGPGARSAVVAVGEIHSRSDVRTAINKICAWYKKNEPSSPVPFMLERASKLIGANFREVIKEIAESAEREVNEIIGPDPNEE